jgi:hypothetical protein
MLLSNSTIIVKVERRVLSNCKLDDFYFFKENPIDNNKRFFSINFFQDGFGEIHWSNSFEHGEMNIIGFFQKENLFFLFTSSVQHHIFLKEILSEFYKETINLSILKLPFPVPENVVLGLENFKSICIDKNIGIVGQIKYNKDKVKLLKMYSNGVITYSLTDNLNDLLIILETSTNILSKYGVILND